MPISPTRAAALASLVLVASAVVLLVSRRIPQDPGYHGLADRRTLLGIPNALDVLSNLPFAVVGVLGLAVVRGGRGDGAALFADPWERRPAMALFLGTLLTAFGSAWYHLAPSNARLVWDRLPITTTLAGLLLSQVADRIGVRTANALLIPAIVVGAATVWYWRATDNLVPYGIAQGYAAIATLWIALAFPSRYTCGSYIYWAFAWFVIAKVCETYDQAIYRMLEVVSGHTLKHLAAAAAGFVVCAMLARRTVRTERASP